MKQPIQNIHKNQDLNFIRLNADFIRELLIPLSTFIENINGLEKVFWELAKILNMNHISLYKILDSWDFEILCEYSIMPSQINRDLTVKRNANLFIASKLWRVSAIPMPNFWDNIVIPVWIDNLYLAAWDSKVSREIAKIENSLFELVAWVVANTIRSMKLIHQANTDKLTGLLNRNALDKYIYEGKNPFDRELSNPEALCMLDIDHFKKFNDTYWHDIWDKVLKHVADLCKDYFWDENKVYRFGWEEIIFIIHKSWNSIAEYVDGVRKKIADTPLVFEGVSYEVKASIGIYTLQEHDLHKKDFKYSALKFADQVLYEAKESWRNQVKVFKRRAGD
ncbi:MAG: diguanylate cyclase [uncultured bacterium (gcode 4)]|uniref:Diguanylate cyclase n=1 Tax=uncultured bacterium (gcode 4) TaxID=1234023 RepID=K2F8G5_9BACT|nr:MAG: diguanylate cyclase [uncultured bacterium (gcode 4)]